MEAIGRQPKRAPDGAPVHYQRHRPELATLYRLVQLHAATFIADTEMATGADLPQFVRDEFDAFLKCGILVYGFLRLRCGGCAVATAATTSWSPSAANGGAFARRAGPGA